jgi:glycosyltransferase involved in cell wall biosynthesis
MNAWQAEFAALPPVRPGCIVSVAIPARDEGAYVVPTLEAFARQRARSGAPLEPGAFEVIVFANDCTDDTARRVNAFAAARPHLAIYVAESTLPPHQRHVGFARRAGMNVAATRMRGAGSSGIVATTDADTLVSPDWIARTIEELRAVEAVGGRVVPGPSVASGGADGGRVYALEHRYRYAVVRLETLLDPSVWDPWPRHGNHQGASFALRARTYGRVGGTPALPVLEDLALYQALLRADVTFRHSLRVRVLTSGRRTSRVEGGYASQLYAIDAHVAERATYLVEHPNETLALYRGRSAVRRGATIAAARAYGLGHEALARHLHEATTIGSALESIEREARASGGLRAYARVPIDSAIEALENYASALAPSAARPTRINA